MLQIEMRRANLHAPADLVVVSELTLPCSERGCCTLDCRACRSDTPVRKPSYEPSFLWSSRRVFALQRENFWVKHYAGKVKYTVEGWVERNMDRVPESFNTTLATSSSQASDAAGRRAVPSLD